jgi:ABC-type transport system involved in multi-copper enzyme maturation permease subunit
MPARWGLGPVFVYEWLMASRRWQMYAVRALVVGVLLGALVLVWEMELRDRYRFQPQQPLSYKDYGRIGEIFFDTIVGTQLALILLAAPGAAAGSVCLDKMRGNLLHLLVTDLSAAEIILGKLAARLLPVLGLVACSVPVLMVCSLLGGLDPYAVAAAYTVMLGVGVFGAALALLFSVWGRKPHEVLLVVYLIEVLWLLAYVIYSAVDATLFKTGTVPDWLRDLNPYALAFAPYTRPNSVEWGEYGRFLLVTGAAAAACTLLAVVSVRPCTLRYDAVTHKPKGPSKRARRRGGPVLDRNPLLWYERHRKRPSRWTRAVWGAYIGFAVLATALALRDILFGGLTPHSFILHLFQAPVGLLLAGVGAMTALAEERVRGHLDVLLATPLPTRAIVWAKWRAAFRPVPWIVAPSAAVAVGMACREGGWEYAGVLVALLLTCGLFLTSFGLALATWIPRVGRAIAYGVGLYAFQCIGWPMVAMLLFEKPNGGQEIGPALLSPLFAVGVFTEALRLKRGFPDVERALSWGVSWVGILLAAAVLLYWLTLVTFDRCLSRVPEGGMRRRRERKMVGEV